MQKEIPMLFSTAMVQALLAGRKLQTRRIKGLENFNNYPDDWKFEDIYTNQVSSFAGMHNAECEHSEKQKCPYGKPRDLIWVRESFLSYSDENGVDKILYKSEPHAKEFSIGLFEGKPKWNPSIHMPKEAARIWLQVESIRVERLQNISEEDARLEGVDILPSLTNLIDADSGEVITGKGDVYRNYTDNSCVCIWPSQSFESLWQSINGPESWQANPWVWVVSFTVVSITGKQNITLSSQAKAPVEM